jgi:hypothetical protein
MRGLNALFYRRWLSQAARYERLARKFRNFSRNRPETTNLNHQYAIRRIFIAPSSMPGEGPTRHG